LVVFYILIFCLILSICRAPKDANCSAAKKRDINSMIDTAPPDGTVVMVLLNYEKNRGKSHARGMD
jgi:hypothetical protein